MRTESTTYIKIIIFAVVFISVVNSFSVCPGKAISLDTFNFLDESVLKYRSINYDVFYKMNYDSGVFKLNCYRVADQQTVPNPVLQIQNISIDGDRTWKIQAVSQRGSCVLVKQGPSLVAYNTYSGSFVKVQNVSVSSLGKNVQYSVNDNCDLIRVLVTDSQGTTTTKVISENSISDSTTYPLGTLFSYDFAYAIDTSSNFYASSSGSVTKTSVSALKSTPLSIKWSQVLNAVITVSNDANGYAIVVVDPLTGANLYSKTLASGSDYNGVLTYLVRTSYGSILLTDDNGLVSFLQFKLSNSLITASENSLYNSTYSSLFSSGSYAAVSGDVIFAYKNKMVTYLQAINGKIYYLGQLPEDIETTGESLRLQYSPKVINIILSLLSPTSLNFCNPVPSTSGTSSTSTIYTPGTATSTVVDNTTGLTLKCLDNCVSCTSSTNCSICKIGYSLNTDTGTCVYCNGCMTCNPTNSTVCYLCFPPQVYNRTSATCVMPQCTTSNCIQCDINGVCTKCMLNYGLVNDQCQKCTSPGCRSCSTNASTCDSDSCMLSYVWYLNPTTNIGVCQPCTTGCISCSVADLSACSTCSVGYYPRADSNGIKRCVSCFANCNACLNATVCTTCASGYLPSSDGSSCNVICSGNCLTCDKSNATKCLTCYAGSTLNTTSNNCVVDFSCNATASCLFCGEGYVLSNGNCIRCLNSDSNCVACLSTQLSTCTECNDGFYLQNNQCVKCTGNCSKCVSSSGCYECKDGFYLVTDSGSDTGVCKPCDSTCFKCSGSAQTCISCANGYTLEGSKCISANRVVFEFVIQANVNNFVEFMDDLMDWLIASINAGKTVGAADITAQQLVLQSTERYGSSIVKAITEAQSSTNAQSVAVSLNTAINSGKSVSGYLIISGSATAQTTASNNTSTTPETTPQSTASSSSSIGIIVGIALPLGILLLVVIGIVSYKVYQKKKSKESTNNLETDGERCSEKQFTASVIKSQKL